MNILIKLIDFTTILQEKNTHYELKFKNATVTQKQLKQLNLHRLQ